MVWPPYWTAIGRTRPSGPDHKHAASTCYPQYRRTAWGTESGGRCTPAASAAAGSWTTSPGRRHRLPRETESGKAPSMPLWETFALKLAPSRPASASPPRRQRSIVWCESEKLAASTPRTAGWRKVTAVRGLPGVRGSSSFQDRTVPRRENRACPAVLQIVVLMCWCTGVFGPGWLVQLPILPMPYSTCVLGGGRWCA